MPSSLQVFEQAEAPLPLTAKAGKNASALPLLSLLTFSPMGNPLAELSPGQCNLFFDYLLMSLHNQRKEQMERVAALTKKIVLPASLSAAAMGIKGLSPEQRARRAQIEEGMKKADEKKAQEEKVAAGNKKGEEGAAGTGKGGGHAGAGATAAGKGGWQAGALGGEGAPGAAGVAGWKFSSLFKQHNEEKKGTGDGGAGPAFTSAFGQNAPAVSGAISQMAAVIDDYARGSVDMEKKVVDALHGGMRAQNYATDDLMASLLLVIEDDAWAGEEGGLGSAKPHGGATRIASLVPRKLRSTAQDSAVVRLASVREMLRYYLRLHPQDYHIALAAALGITSDQEEDSTFLQERLAYELASIGSFALAQKLLAEIKLKRKMDTKECLLRLGYRYDAKSKRLIIGKRTCGKPAEARGIIGLLLASARKKAK
ncbi:MAG: hypothetical protein NTX79_01605 [Candidatus Micrarchaeota archaeon]|nr:hypothetical protein [Candidatus Micrarchaeota archaeon]